MDIRICTDEMDQKDRRITEPKFPGSAPSPGRGIKYPRTCGWRRRWARVKTAHLADQVAERKCASNGGDRGVLRRELGAAIRPGANRIRLGRIHGRPDARQPSWRVHILLAPPDRAPAVAMKARFRAPRTKEFLRGETPRFCGTKEWPAIEPGFGAMGYFSCGYPPRVLGGPHPKCMGFLKMVAARLGFLKQVAARAIRET